MAGFFTGEGCFSVYKNFLRVSIAQRSRDKILINNFINILNCGTSYNTPKGITVFTVNKFEDIYNKIIPLFKEYNIRGVKALDFKDFCLAAELIKKKAHLTKDGLEQIKIIKSRMNRKRIIKS